MNTVQSTHFTLKKQVARRRPKKEEIHPAVQSAKQVQSESNIPTYCIDINILQQMLEQMFVKAYHLRSKCLAIGT